MTKLEELTRRLISKVKDPLDYAEKEVINYHSGYLKDMYADGTYANIIYSKVLIKEIETELESLSEKEGSSKKFKQKKLF